MGNGICVAQQCRHTPIQADVGLGNANRAWANRQLRQQQNIPYNPDTFTLDRPEFDAIFYPDPDTCTQTLPDNGSTCTQTLPDNNNGTFHHTPPDFSTQLPYSPEPDSQPLSRSRSPRR